MRVAISRSSTLGFPIFRCVFLTVGVLAAAASGVHAQTPTQIQKTFQADYNAQDQAFGRNDPLGATAYFAPDFVVINRATGQVTPNELAHQRGLVSEIHKIASKSVTAHTDITHFTLNPPKTQAEVVIQTRYIALAVSPKTGKPLTIVINGVYEETWAKRPSGWRIVSQQKISTRANAS